jgi:hypothetical protein
MKVIESSYYRSTNGQQMNREFKSTQIIQFGSLMKLQATIQQYLNIAQETMVYTVKSAVLIC